MNTIQHLITRYHEGTIKETELAGDKPAIIHVYHSSVPEHLVLSSSEDTETKTFVASMSRDKQDALNFYKMATANTGELLLQSHNEVTSQLISSFFISHLSFDSS